MILRTEIRSYPEFYKKRVVPLLIPLVSWSLIYGLYNQYYILQSKMNAYEFVLDFGYRLLTDRTYVHLWFLYAIIAIYMTVPFNQQINQNMQRAGSSILFAAMVHRQHRLSLHLRCLFRATDQYINIPIMNIPFFMGFLGYFILGYYLFHYELPPRAKNIVFNLGIVSFFLTPVATYFVSQRSGVLDEMFYGNYSITTFFMAAGMFIYFKEKEEQISEK